MGTASRVYGGRSAEQRRADRRRRLLDAAMAIWGEAGWAAVTMRRVCAEAGVIDRYFYESFADRDELLAAVWDEVRDETFARVTGVLAATEELTVAEQLRAAITAFVEQLVLDPVRARIGLGDHAGSAVLEQRRRATLLLATDVLLTIGRPRLRAGADEAAVRMTALLGIGGFIELVTAWQGGLLEVSADQLIEHASAIGAQLASDYVT